jgi:N-acylneuraminate cytidylyltransferase
MNELFLITARGGSKGIPNKNIKQLCGKPLLCYSIDSAREFVDDNFICVSTDSAMIKSVVESYGLKVPFIRPKILSEDASGSFDVIKHALQYYEKNGRNFGKVVLLQPTSPIRERSHIQEAMLEFENNNLEALYSVKYAEATPSYLLYEEVEGLLKKCQNSHQYQRKVEPTVYQVNGSIYIFNTEIFEKYKSFNEIKRIGKYVMPKEYSVDIDDTMDWNISEMLLNFNLKS